MVARCLTVLLVALLGACAAGASDGPAKKVSAKTSTAPKSATHVAITKDDLIASMPVPAMCEFEPTTLVNGTSSWAEEGVGGIYADSESIVLGDLTGDGLDDAAVKVNCTAGGVSWGDQVFAYDRRTDGTTELIGELNLLDFDAPGVVPTRPWVESLRIEDGTVQVEARTHLDGDAACCGSLPLTADLEVSDGKLTVKDVAYRFDEASARKVVEHVLRPTRASAGRGASTRSCPTATRVWRI